MGGARGEEEGAETGKILMVISYMPRCELLSVIFARKHRYL